MNAQQVKANLPRTWGAFFGRYGHLTPAQLAAIPHLLAGENLILCAATASGKTEAALAPLIERWLPPTRPTPQLTLLYLLPTRALINDLANRLAAPLDVLRTTLAVKTHDLDTFDPSRPADLLLTTPESLDALLANQPAKLTTVRGVIIDELHVLDATARGDQLRVLLSRLRQVRSYALRMGDAPDAAVQYVALSATLAQPAAAAARFFAGGRVVQAPGDRTVAVEHIALAPDTPAALLDYLRTFRARGLRKALAFCNTRAEVEAYAAAVRAADTPFGDAVFVHYSNLETERRRAVEAQFAEAQAALCFASSTLELGIDIGSIDAALLIGAPGSAASFMQRLGRAGRRRRTALAACFYRTPLERLQFAALSEMETGASSAQASFRPAVAVQQIFSLLRQSPTAAVRLAPLSELFADLLPPADLEALLGHLQALDYLAAGRPGEWKAGDRLNHLVDLQSFEHNPLSLYSNIQTTPTTQLKIRDRSSGRVMARVDRRWLDRETLTLEGRPLSVEWFDGDALWVAPSRSREVGERLPFLAGRQVLSFDLAQQLARQLGLAPGAAPLIGVERGWLLFHWLGDLYGQALLDLLRYTLSAELTAQPGLCLRLTEEPAQLRGWSLADIRAVVSSRFRRYEPLLQLGAYQHLLPRRLRTSAVIEGFDAPRFHDAAASLRLLRVPDRLSEELISLV